MFIVFSKTICAEVAVLIVTLWLMPSEGAHVRHVLIKKGYPGITILNIVMNSDFTSGERLSTSASERRLSS